MKQRAVDKKNSVPRKSEIGGDSETARLRPSDALECVVVGGSAGAIDALGKILPRLSANFGAPIVCVVHLPPDEKSLLVDIFRSRCQLTVKEAEDKETLERGTVYFAPPNYHVLAESDRTLSLSSDAPVLYSRPSIDVLFESAADAFGTGLLAIVLTGANSDGAAGAKCVSAAGGRVWIQRPDTAEASLMPNSALEKCPRARALLLAEIASELQAWSSARGGGTAT